jgi:hypothetical protein
MIHGNKIKNSMHELSLSFTLSSGVIYLNKLEILITIKFTENFAILFNIIMETAIRRLRHHSSYFGGTIPEQDIINILVLSTYFLKAQPQKEAIQYVQA